MVWNWDVPFKGAYINSIEGRRALICARQGARFSVVIHFRPVSSGKRRCVSGPGEVPIIKGVSLGTSLSEQVCSVNSAFRHIWVEPE